LVGYRRPTTLRRLRRRYSKCTGFQPKNYMMSGAPLINYMLSGTQIAPPNNYMMSGAEIASLINYMLSGAQIVSSFKLSSFQVSSSAPLSRLMKICKDVVARQLELVDVVVQLHELRRRYRKCTGFQPKNYMLLQLCSKCAKRWHVAGDASAMKSARLMFGEGSPVCMISRFRQLASG